MLTAEHVRTRKKNGELLVRNLDAKEKERALVLAAAYLEVARASVGARREDLEEAWDAVPVAARDRRLADGLKKLIEDVSEFSAESPVEPAALRSEIFLAASAGRQSLTEEARFDRDFFIGDAAARHGILRPELERAIYADLKAEQLLLSVASSRPEVLVDRYDRAQIQAVLLRAVRVTAVVTCRSPAAYRALFRELKFRRLLFRIERQEPGGYRIDIDGPYSLFESVTKYGLQLALVLPALEACDGLSLVAEVRWGKARESLAFRYQKAGAGNGPDKGAPVLRDDVAVILEAFAALDTPWKVTESDTILDIPGLGICVPDLVFEHRKTLARVFFEALGFWSRDAVWKRVELAKKGLGHPILFAVSSRLRVSEAVLEEGDAAALYVYKGVMSARSIEQRLGALARKR